MYTRKSLKLIYLHSYASHFSCEILSILMFNYFLILNIKHRIQNQEVKTFSWNSGKQNSISFKNVKEFYKRRSFQEKKNRSRRKMKKEQNSEKCRKNNRPYLSMI